MAQGAVVRDAMVLGRLLGNLESVGSDKALLATRRVSAGVLKVPPDLDYASGERVRITTREEPVLPDAALLTSRHLSVVSLDVNSDGQVVVAQESKHLLWRTGGPILALTELSDFGYSQGLFRPRHERYREASLLTGLRFRAASAIAVLALLLDRRARLGSASLGHT